MFRIFNKFVTAIRYCAVAGLMGSVCLPAQNLLFAQAPVMPAVDGDSLALVPMPREVHKGALLSLKDGISITVDGRDAEDRFAAQDLVTALQARGVTAHLDGKEKVRIVLVRQDTKLGADVLARTNLRFDPAMKDEGYVLATEGDTTYDIAATSAGIYYGAQTLKQLAVSRSGDVILQGVLARDWPAMKYRGLDDDLSRGPVPTLAYQKHQIQTLSEYKINIYSPYFENTLRHSNNALAAPPGGAMTPDEVRELVRFASQYHVTIIPEQEAFGHLHHTLQYEMYSALSETPHGSVLAPGQPGSIDLIHQWFAEMATMFPGPFVHIGADETFDLGSGQTKSLVEQQGLGKVYIDFVKQIYSSLAPLHKQLLFWGDIAMNEPELVKTLPKDMIAVAWEYRPHPEGYDKWIRPFTDAGMETWVAPSLSDMRVVYPNNDVALRNIQKFVSDGQRLGSTGELNTVWDANNGEGLFDEDWYGALFGAAAAWQAGTSSIPQFQNSFAQVFHGDWTGKINQAHQELIAGHALMEKAGFPGASEVLFWVDPWSPEGQEASAKVLPVAHELRLHAERAVLLINEAREQEARTSAPLREDNVLDAMEMGARRMDFLAYKFQAAQEIVDEYRHAYEEQQDPNSRKDIGHRLGNIYGINGQCQDMREGFGLLRDLYQQAWLKENRSYWLDNVLAHYELNIELWIRRGERFGVARDQFSKTHTLPKPEELGLPASSGLAQ